jgi:hypothetical protein
MPDADAVNAVPIVGGPIAYGLAVVALLLAVLARSWAGAVVTVAHEAGHMVMGVLTFRGLRGWWLEDNGDAATAFDRRPWSVSWIATLFTGYAMPPLLGLAGARLIADRHPASVLWICFVLVVAAMVHASNALAYLVTVLEAVVIGCVATVGSLQVQAGLAVGLVWLLLIGGAQDSIRLSWGPGSDAQALAAQTWIPRIVWHALWAVIGVVCLWKGGGWLLGFG